jgi:hypothetical protein
MFVQSNLYDLEGIVFVHMLLDSLNYHRMYFYKQPYHLRQDFYNNQLDNGNIFLLQNYTHRRPWHLLVRNFRYSKLLLVYNTYPFHFRLHRILC